MPLILPGNVGSATAATGYDVANSLRFNDGSSDALIRTLADPGGAGNRNKWTFSTWLKRTALGANQWIFGSYQNSSYSTALLFKSDDTLQFFDYYNGSFNGQRRTNRVFRDTSAWYHIVAIWDKDNSTTSEKMRIYVNGTEETSFSASSAPSNATTLNADGQDISIGQKEGVGDYFDGYMCEVVFNDGQAYAADNYGEFDSDSPNVWKPKDVSGLTFGTTGFHLDFEDSSALGNDVSGNDNDFTVNNLTSVDQTTDTCTNNFAIINVNDNYWAGATIEEGATKVTTGSSNEAMNTSTFAMTKGKWYMEVDNISGAGARLCGITPTPSFQTSSHGKSGDVTPHTVCYLGSGAVQEGNGSGGQTTLATYASYSNGNIIGVYMDLDNMKAYFSKDGSLQSSTGIDLEPLISNGTGHYMFFAGDNNAGSRVFEANFGNPFQSQSSSVADDNGFGKFEYSPNITGDGSAKSFYSCCTKNLAEFG